MDLWRAGEFSVALGRGRALEFAIEEFPAMLRTRAPLIGGLGLAALCAALPALATTSIADIVDHPDDWANAQVTVIGTVVELTLGYKGESFYTLAGDGRRISVVSPSPAPTVGDHLRVSGKVGRRPPDEEFDFPPVILESGRQAAP
jgi:hypothetical protein